MSADITEQNAAGGDDLRARYLPVSRKELRRRREAELTAQREAQEAADAAADELALESDDDADSAEESAEFLETDDDELSGSDHTDADQTDDDAAVDEGTAEQDAVGDAPVVEDAIDESQLEDPESEDFEDGEALTYEPPVDAEDELSRAVEDTTASETDDLPEAPEPEDVDEPADTTEISVETPEAALPEPADAEEPARPEEEVADVEQDFPTEDVTAGEVLADDLTEILEGDSTSDEEEPDVGHSSDAPAVSWVDTQDAPIPASRRAKRLLRETEAIPAMSSDLLAELDATQAEIAKADDPNKVDPELLKKQQALAAKAMQANQERMRREHAAAEKEARRRRRERPESEILTGKMVRDSLNQDPEEMEYHTGQIEPVHAQGAHGLDLKKLIDATDRQVGRQNVLMWLVIILAVLLAIAVGAVIFFLVL